MAAAPHDGFDTAARTWKRHRAADKTHFSAFLNQPPLKLGQRREDSEDERSLEALIEDLVRKSSRSSKLKSRGSNTPNRS
jgi:hypothetical protein